MTAPEGIYLIRTDDATPLLLDTDDDRETVSQSEPDTGTADEDTMCAAEQARLQALGNRT
ncbi:hypothetical protein NE562_13825 [Butyricicoccus faecihominis]|uniref:hypothetical protein n=1 Tax=Butyricicoccus faecihominis TaxID=1712515 RepID=UPI00247B0CD9|nr:hypothetical protein [Butyricicoccus faecihominis]MCQ5130747.1 hypothetical protein [Butyricicoccus faecihominis]